MEKHQNLSFENEAYLAGSVQSALIGYSTPNLRAICIEFFIRVDKPKDFINLLVYYDNPPSELEQELANLTFTEFISLCIFEKYEVGLEIITLEIDHPIPERGLLAYHRYEPGQNKNDHIKSTKPP